MFRFVGVLMTLKSVTNGAASQIEILSLHVIRIWLIPVIMIETNLMMIVRHR